MQTRPIRLTVMQPNASPVKLDFGGPLITLGRAVECTIPIKDRYLSRRHAEIVSDEGVWKVRDCGSVNGTLLNGVKIGEPIALREGDRIGLGDTQIIFHAEVSTDSQFIALDSDSHARSIAVPLRQSVDDSARKDVLASLALQFIEDRSMGELFEFILDRVVELLQPSRAAIALLGEEQTTFSNVLLRRRDSSDSTDLFISRTLLGEVIDGRNVVAFVDNAENDRLARAESIVSQNIRSAVCAPLLVGDRVLGVLYLDFFAHKGTVTHAEVNLVAQIARFAAVKLETVRLREEAIEKAQFEQELRMAYAIQRRLLPEVLPFIQGYELAGSNKPCRTVSGDYYDVMVRPDGRVYFVIADVSGKGITAAIIMASVATAFNIFTRTDPAPADLLRELNATLAPKTGPSKFVTMVVGVLDPTTGVVDFANAGHVSPLLLKSSGIEVLSSTDLVVGLFPRVEYRNQQLILEEGDSLVLFTDGVTEAEDAQEQQLGLEPVSQLLAKMHCSRAVLLLESIEDQVEQFCGGEPSADDVTMLALTRL
jgi:phosphoserine phosphatase RsbU/P